MDQFIKMKQTLEYYEKRHKELKTELSVQTTVIDKQR